MLEHASWLYQWFGTLCQRLLLRFGFHCATHQIRIILVSCVVITSLFYPALAIYASSQPNSLSIIDAFVSRSAVSGFHAPNDLDNLWSCHHTLRVHEDAVTRAKCGVGRALRVERLLIHGPMDEDVGAMNHQTLRSTLDFEHRLEETILQEESTPCLRRADGKCFVLSPLLFWNHDLEALLSDTNPLSTIKAVENVSLGGFHVTPQMVLARRRSLEPAASKLDFAEYLAVTYFFPESNCLGSSEHASWLQAVQKAVAQEPEGLIQMREPTLIALEYNLDLSRPDGWSPLSVFLYLAYIGFFGYVVWSVGNMTAVHSRLGVTFTALVEIACSTITSLSVCALAGFKITMVPWEVLPIVIMFVGAENMFNLVDAVCKTPVTLSVKQRIAEGLSRAGTSNTLKVVIYNTILGIIAIFSVGAVRQFCSFAIVVLVAHWFLAHTFFLAVLSIDIQRLELEELLRHDPSMLTLHRSQHYKDHLPKQPRSHWRKLAFAAQHMLRGRATTNLSLLMLLAIAATLYYTTYTTSTLRVDQRSVSQLTATPLAPIYTPPPHLPNQSAAWHIWKTLNPSQTPLLHLRIEVPILVTFRPVVTKADTNEVHKTSRFRFSLQTFHLAFWLLKIMVFPIAATTTILWGLLLYLLKNAELLEAQRNRAGPNLPDLQGKYKITEGQIVFSTLPRVITSDVEHLAASKDGDVVISVGIHNEITIWWVSERTHVSIDAAEALLRVAGTLSISMITCVAMDQRGNYCAVGTSTGTIAVWILEKGCVRALPPLFADNSSSSVDEIQFLVIPSPASPQQSSSRTEPATELCLLATYEGGLAAKWSLQGSVTYFTPSRSAVVVKCSLVCVHSSSRFLIAFGLADGTLELLETGDIDPWILPEFCVQAGDPFSIPVKVHACEAYLGGSSRRIVVVATETGMVSLWDGSTAECISVFDDAFGRINHLQVMPANCEICHFCGQLPLESVSVAVSVDHIIRFFRLYLNDQTRRCSCSCLSSRNVTSRDTVSRRPRSNSSASQHGSSTVSPAISRSRVATTLKAPAFPVSAHGVHSRRMSEKESGRRSSDMPTISLPNDEHNTDSRTLLTLVPSLWHDAVLVQITDIACERGGWGVHDKRFVGVRRRPRTRGNIQGGMTTASSLSSSQGLTAAILERWELWTFDPSASSFQSSLLAALTIAQPPSSPSSTNCAPRLPFTRVSPLLIASRHAFAGLGNTIGIFYFS